MPRLSRTGTEPVTARSAYGLRRVLAWFALVAGLLAAGAFGLAALHPAGSAPAEGLIAGICLLTALVALADLIVLRNRPSR